jgi:hypothetical protein
MPNGLLRLFDKVTNNLLVNLQILGTFNIEQNLNDTPSNMKIKAITNASFREEFEVNTIAYHEDTNTWWVIKSDESTYLHTGEYEHEISLVEFLEFFAYRHLANCAFAPNTYTLDQMLKRIFRIGNVIDVNFSYPSFLDKDKIMPFMSFENFTVANAIKNVARSLNAIPKMSGIFSSVDGGSIIGTTLTFVNRLGIENTIVNILNDQFPVAYEKNANSNDQFLTRSVSNITNAKSSNLAIAPKSGGFKNVTPNSLLYDANNSKVFLPSKIDSVQFIRLYTPIRVSRFIVGSSTSTTLFQGYYLDAEAVKNAIIDNLDEFSIFTLSDLQALSMPDTGAVHQINLNDTLGGSYPNTFFRGLHTLKSKFDFDTSDKLTGDYNEVEKVKDKTIHWLPFTNEIILGKTIRDGMTVPLTGAAHYRGFTIAQKTSGTTIEQINIEPILKTVGFFNNRIAIDELLVQVGYFPISDIKVSIDNDNNAQDEKFFNQTGKVIDAFSTTQLITSHTNDSVEGTKIRNARYTNFNNLLPVGQLVRDNNIIYVISQRSIDGQVKDGNEYYNVLYTLSRNRIARSENIVADSSVISYKTPDDNLVFRNQLYKDYIELSMYNTNQDTPYLPMSKALVFNESLAGTNFDYTVLASNNYGTAPQIRYVKNPINYDLHKSKLMNVNWQDNNVLGFRLDSTSSTSYVQTPIVYTDEFGKATAFELLFLDTENLNNAVAYYNANITTDPIVPFGDLTNVPNTFYTTSAINQNNVSIRINSNTRTDMSQYNKDPFEIPVFEYMLQANDEYSDRGNVVVGNDLFSTFTGDLIYRYLIINDTRITAENADRLFGDAGGLGWLPTTNNFYYQTTAPDLPIYGWDVVSNPYYHQDIDPSLTTYKWQLILDDYYYGSNDPTQETKQWNLIGATLYYQDAEPTGGDIGDFWYSEDISEFFIKTSSGWTDIYTYENNQNVVFGVSSTPPTITVNRQYWINNVDGEVYISEIIAGSSVSAGSVWYDTDAEALYTRTSSNTWLAVGSGAWVSGFNDPNLTPPTLINNYFVSLDEPSIYISVVDTTPTITENSYWFDTTDSTLYRYEYFGDDLFWNEIMTTVLTGTSLPSVGGTGVFFVNTSLKVLYISVVESIPTIPTNSFWYNPTNGTLSQYLLVGGFNEWNSVSGTLYVNAIEPEPTLAGQYWVNPTNETLSISQTVPPANPVLASNDFNQVLITRTGNNLFLALIPDIDDPDTENELPIKNIGIYAFDTNTNKAKFLFAINDYVEGSNSGSNNRSNINVYINNWKI